MKPSTVLFLSTVLAVANAATVPPVGKGSKSPKSTILPKETKSGGSGKGGSKSPKGSEKVPTMAPTTTIDIDVASSSFPLRLRGRMTRRRLHRGDGTEYSALEKKNKGSSPSPKTSRSSKGAKTTTAAPTSAPTLEDTEFLP